MGALAGEAAQYTAGYLFLGEAHHAARVPVDYLGLSESHVARLLSTGRHLIRFGAGT